MALELFEVLHLTNSFLQSLLQLGHVVFGENEILARARIESSFLIGRSAGIAKVSTDGLLHGLAATEQPEHDEQRHHGGDEIGIGDLPRAAMMAAVATFFLEDDNGPSFVHDFVGI